jgi:CBS domain-containing protein
MPDPSVVDIMRRDVPSVRPDDSVATVARLMADSGLPGVPVVENDEIVGIVTEADIITREANVEVPPVIPILDGLFVADAGRDFNEDLRRVLAVTASQLMTSPVYNIRSSATLEQVATLMLDRKINPVPVVDDNLKWVGIVSRADLVRIIARLESAGTSDASGERSVSSQNA